MKRGKKTIILLCAVLSSVILLGTMPVTAFYDDASAYSEDDYPIPFIRIIPFRMAVLSDTGEVLREVSFEEFMQVRTLASSSSGDISYCHYDTVYPWYNYLAYLEVEIGTIVQMSLYDFDREFVPFACCITGGMMIPRSHTDRRWMYLGTTIEPAGRVSRWECLAYLVYITYHCSSCNTPLSSRLDSARGGCGSIRVSILSR